MRIGWLSQALPYLPSRGGFRLYGGNLIRCLARRQDVDLVSLLVDDDSDHLAWAREHCASVETLATYTPSVAQRVGNLAASYVWGDPIHFRRAMHQLLTEQFAKRKWDVLHIEGGFVAGLVPRELPVAKVLSLHDSWTLRCEEMLKCSQSVRESLYYRLLTCIEPRYERLVYPRFDCCTVVAQRDLDAVRGTVPAAALELIPYGTDTEYFVPLQRASSTDLVFHSHLGYAPNVEAAAEVVEAILPRVRREIPGVTLRLVGASPSARVEAMAARPGVELCANVPDLRPAVCGSSVYVCAIRHGTGLKSKVLEAMAMGMPIVCYPGSTVGINCEDGKHLLVARTADEFARHVVHLLRDPQRAKELGRAGRKLVEEEYSWDSRAIAYERLYERVRRRHRIQIPADTPRAVA